MDSSTLFYLLLSLFFLVLYPAVLALIAKLKGRSWLAWGAIGVACALIPVIGLIGWVVSIIVLLVRPAAGTAGASHAMPRDLNATHWHDNIAINAQNGNVWLREKSGRAIVVHSSDIKNLNHTWASNNNAQAYRNRLEVTVNNLDKPVWVIEFDRHNESWIYKGRNKQEANEWAARLSSL
ncbi:MAG: hypothetical protein ACREP4_07425 [Stenotrophomonas sp.]|uniref:hypothetical protein n=1 Tax=Stenotrophomonas sp. TaxID=69392 RepID=UPI003D6D75E7